MAGLAQRFPAVHAPSAWPSALVPKFQVRMDSVDVMVGLLPPGALRAAPLARERRCGVLGVALAAPTPRRQL